MPTTARASNTVQIRLSMLNVTGKIANIRCKDGEKATKMFLVDPGNHPVTQIYVCAEDPATCKPDNGELGWRISDLPNRGMYVGEAGKVVVMTQDEIDDARGCTLESGLLELAVHPAEQVDAQTWPSGTTYWFEPEKPESNPIYRFLTEMVEDRTIALVGTMNLRGAGKFYRLIPAPGGGLLLSELLRPSELHETEAPLAKEPGEKEWKMGRTLVSALVEDFDPEAYANERVAALRALIDSKTPDGSVTQITKAKKAPKAEDDLTAMLEAALALAEAKKAQPA